LWANLFDRLKAKTAYGLKIVKYFLSLSSIIVKPCFFACLSISILL
jgi:hypothetical protein